MHAEQARTDARARACWEGASECCAHVRCMLEVQMEDRFKVEASDDIARAHIFTLIDQSIANMLASVGDTAHRIASNFRA